MSFSKRNRKALTIWLSNTGAVACRLLPVLLLASVLSGCTGSKGLYKKGNQLQQAGLYEDAANYYYNALLRNRNNVDARIGLTETGQRVLNDRLDEFTRARALDEHPKAVSNYERAMAYRARVEGLGIRLSVPDYMNQDYELSKNFYIQELYNKGNELMAERRFDEANAAFKEIARLDPNYKDIRDLKRVSRNEPLYIAGSNLFDAGDYRKAFAEFDKVFRDDPNYKDVAVLRAECLNLGRFPVAVLPFENASGRRDAEKRVHAFVLTELTNLNDPFLRIVERDNMELILKEQRLSLSGIIDESTAARAGNLLGAKAIISGSLLTYTVKPGTMRTTEKNAYEAFQVKLYNAAEDRHYFETRFNPVKYREHYNLNEVTVSFQYRCVSLETGEVIFSRIVERSLNSEVYFATYDGEITNLYPAGNQGVVTSNRERSQLTALFRANREIKSPDQLSNEAFTHVAKELSRDLTRQMQLQ